MRQRLRCATDRIADDKNKLGQYRTLRLHSAIAIIWRAAAIHTELWDNNAAEDERLDVDMLQELLDRRLRLVERMEMQANAPIARVAWRIL